MMQKLAYTGILLICGFGLSRIFQEIQTSILSTKVGPQVKIDSTKLLRGFTPIVGTSNASYQLVEFMDYECGPCRKEYAEIKQVLSDRKFCLYIHQFPLPTIHHMALRAARLSSQLLNTPVWLKWHDRLISDRLCDDLLSQFETEARRTITNQWDDRRASSIVEADRALGRAVGVQHTPTLFLIHSGEVFEVTNPTALRNL